MFTEVTSPAVTTYLVPFTPFCLWFLQGTCLITGCYLHPAALHGREMVRSVRARDPLPCPRPPRARRPAVDSHPPSQRLAQIEVGGIRLCQVCSVLNILPSSTRNPLTPRQRPSTPEAALSQTSSLSWELNSSVPSAGAQHPTLSCLLLCVHCATAVPPGRFQPIRVLSFDRETNPNWHMGRGASTP